MTDSKLFTEADPLTSVLHRYPSLEKLVLFRNLYVGSAAASFVLILQLWDKGVTTNARLISVCAAVIAVPLWIALGMIYEYYIVAGPKSYQHKRQPKTRQLCDALLGFASILIYIAFAALVFDLGIGIFTAFALSSALMVLVMVRFHADLAQWYRTNDP